MQKRPAAMRGHRKLDDDIKKPKVLTRITVKFKDGTFGAALHRQTVIIDFKDHGHLKDGRAVSYVNGAWTYEPQ